MAEDETCGATHPSLKDYVCSLPPGHDKPTSNNPDRWTLLHWDDGVAWGLDARGGENWKGRAQKAEAALKRVRDLADEFDHGSSREIGIGSRIRQAIDGTETGNHSHSQSGGQDP